MSPYKELEPVYTAEKKPQIDNKGRVLYVRAPELPFDWSANFWQESTDEMNKQINRTNCQIVVLTPYQDDVTHKFLKSLKHNQLGKFPVGTTIEQEFPDRELKTLIDNEVCGAGSIYIVASILTERDFSRVRKVADHYKNTLKTQYVTLVSPYLGSTREDKNVNSKGEYEPSVTSVRAELGGLAPFIDRMIVIEPHSSATQACAAQFGIPLAPISPWKVMVEELFEKIKIDHKNSVVVRPDKGRNLAAIRIGEHLQIPSVSFDKVRLSGQAVTILELSDTEKALVKGKSCLIYDDEAATMSTIYDIAEVLSGYGADCLAVCLVHCKFTHGWEDKIKHPLFSIVLGTDSRQPIGNINIADTIELISLKQLLRELIQADINGTNFWSDPKFKDMILQSN